MTITRASNRRDLAFGVKTGEIESRFPIIMRNGRNGGTRRVTVFGISHGYNGDFAKYAKEARAIIDRQTRGERKNDYHLVEGYETDLARKILAIKNDSLGKDEEPQDHIALALSLDAHPVLGRVAERFEWHYPFPHTKEEQTVILAERNATQLTDFFKSTAGTPEEVATLLREFFEMTSVASSIVEEVKAHETRELAKLTGLPEEAVRKVVEKRTTFRSLLAARTAMWRSELMDTSIYMGSLHADEILRFLTEPGFFAQYVANLTPLLRGIYEKNEMMQESVTTVMRNGGRLMKDVWKRLFIRWDMYALFECEYDLRSPTIGFDEFDTEIVRLKRVTGRNDPCFCGSGSKFKKCCGS